MVDPCPDGPRRSRAHHQHVAPAGPDRTAEDRSGPGPAVGFEQLVASRSAQHRPSSRPSEQGLLEMGVLGVTEAVEEEEGSPQRAEQVELVADVDGDPLVDAQVLDHQLLPPGLVGLRGINSLR